MRTLSVLYMLVDRERNDDVGRPLNHICRFALTMLFSYCVVVIAVLRTAVLGVGQCTSFRNGKQYS